jgi:flavin-binding protein dodecin
VSKAADSLHDITGAWVKEQSVKVANGKVAEYRVNLKVTFVLKDAPKAVTKSTKAKKK